MRLTKTALALVLSLGSTAAIAEGTTHEMLILDNTFFPEEIILKEGDSIKFVNKTGHTRRVTAKDSSWNTYDIDPGHSKTVLFAPDTYPTFQTGYDGRIQGEIFYMD